jgi:hypothetical protein
MRKTRICGHRFDGKDGGLRTYRTSRPPKN